MGEKLYSEKEKMIYFQPFYVYKLIEVLKDKMLQANNTTYKNEFKMVYKSVLSFTNYDKQAIIASLFFLKSYLYSDYSFENSNGEIVSTSGGLIKDWYFFDETEVFEITISPYWANKIVSSTSTYWANEIGSLPSTYWHKLHDDLLLSNKDNKGI